MQSDAKKKETMQDFPMQSTYGKKYRTTAIVYSW